MAIVLGVLAALAIISAVGSASKVARQRSGQPGNTSAAKAVQKSIETVQKAIETPALPAAESPKPQSTSPEIESSQSVPSEPQSIETPEPQSIEPAPTESEPVAAESDVVTKELVDSILERMPDVPMAASLLVSEVVNPEGNDLGVQLDRPNYPIDPQETPPTHHGHNLIEEIAEIDQGDRISQLALALEDPDSAMRVSAAYALGDLATRTQGADRDQIMAILVRLSEDVDPQVRVQAANALGSLGNPVMGE